MASPSYPAWYSLPEQDPYGGEYTDVFAALAAAAPVQDPAALLNHFLTGQDKKAAFILLGADDLMCVIHHLQLFQPPLGAAQGGGTYATLSDVTIMGATMVAALATHQ